MSTSSISPAAAVNQINSIVSQLRVANITPQQEANLEQQLVKTISGANPSANWGMIATIADDVSQQSVSAAVTIDVQALDRMVAPTTSSTLNSAIGAIAQQLRGQSPFPDGITTLTTNALANSTAVTLPSTLGMFNGDTVKIKLDNGQAFSAKITTILGDTVNLSTRLPSQASAGAFFTNTAQQTRDQSTSGATAASRAITTTLNASSAAGATTVKLASATGMVTGDAVQIQLLDGSTFNTTIAGITGSTALSTDALANSTAIAVTDATGMHNGDAVQIKLDDGSVFNTIIGSIAGNTVTISGPLPSKASTGATFSDSSNITATLAAPLPVTALNGNSFTDTASVPASTTAVSFSMALTADAAAQATTITVADPGSLAAGDPVQISLDNGSVFNTTISNVTGSTVTLLRPLPSAASVANNATLTDTADLGSPSNAFTASVIVSPQMQAMLQLQLNVLIGTANPNTDVSTLQSLEGNLISSTLTTAQFQQDLTTLIKLATDSTASGTKLSILA